MHPIRRRTASPALASVAVALAVGGCAAPAEPDPVRTSSAPPPSPSAACPASGVRIQPGPVEAAMGLRAMGVTLTNCGERPYSLNGYPDLQVLDEQREPLDVEVLEGTDPITSGLGDRGPHPVTLEPGESARTVLAWRNTVTDPTTVAVNGPYLRVTPTKGGPSEVIAPDGGLDVGNTGRLGTTAWDKEQDVSGP
ncbi:hypothetical protein GCM10010145_15320 [Streptomyces ruber]|uniref:DUF4232 domain-containing protein n=2 Tax=Streptomyces TaxID=1883 RepID=A0A918BAZ2_9ACTN|nr:DUF4232 domain-containing protein [Streptomyces ruber]GGQ47281.1 hypothetical protein GCM10010145_15320 [Streptomyces ruber]